MLIFGGIKRLLTSVELHTIVICCRLVKTAPVHIAHYFKLLHFSPCNTASITKGLQLPKMHNIMPYDYNVGLQSDMQHVSETPRHFPYRSG